VGAVEYWGRVVGVVVEYPVVIVFEVPLKLEVFVREVLAVVGTVGPGTVSKSSFSLC
jgi:hypothetical protein